MSKEDKKTLVELHKEFQELVEQMDELIVDNGKLVNPESGEFFPMNKFDQLLMSFEEKMRNCLYVYSVRYPAQIAGLQGQKDFLKEQIAIIDKKIDSVDKKKKSFGDYILYCNGGKGWRSQDDSFGYSVRNDKSVLILDQKLIPEEYMKTKVKTEITPDKLAIKAKLKAGEKIPGVTLQDNFSLRV